MLATARSSKDKLQKDYSQLSEKVAKIQSDLEEQIHQNATLLSENGQKQISIKAKDEEIAVAKAETSRITKIQAQSAKKLKSLEEAREQAEQQRDILKSGTNQKDHSCVRMGQELHDLFIFFKHCRCGCTREAVRNGT